MNKNFEHFSITDKTISPIGPTKEGNIPFFYRKDIYGSPGIRKASNQNRYKWIFRFNNFVLFSLRKKALDKILMKQISTGVVTYVTSLLILSHLQIFEYV